MGNMTGAKKGHSDIQAVHCMQIGMQMNAAEKKQPQKLLQVCRAARKTAILGAQ